MERIKNVWEGCVRKAIIIAVEVVLNVIRFVKHVREVAIIVLNVLIIQGI